MRFQSCARSVDIITESLALKADDDWSRHWSTLAAFSSTETMTAFEVVPFERGHHLHLAIDNRQNHFVRVLCGADFWDTVEAEITSSQILFDCIVRVLEYTNSLFKASYLGVFQV